MLPHAARVWGSLALGVTLLDVWCDRGDPNGDTLSEQTRALFHTDTTLGKAVWTCAVAFGASWLHGHIANGPLPSSPFST